MNGNTAVMVLIAENMALAAAMCLVWYILYVVAAWKIFTKAGEAGWKSIIPFYNTFIQYKISWNTRMFWVTVLGLFIGKLAIDADNVFIVMLGSVIGMIALITNLIDTYKLSKAFGHGILFMLGLIFINPLFTLILGFGSSKYQGPQ